MEVLGACRFGFAGGCGDELKTMGESGFERVRKVWAVVGFWSGLESCGSGFVARWWSRFRAGEAVALWSVSGAERAAGGAASGSCHPRACGWDV